MNWIWLLCRDFFFALGVAVFFGAWFVSAFLDGRVEGVNTFWLIFAAWLYSFAMGIFYHWPKDLEEKE